MKMKKALLKKNGVKFNLIKVENNPNFRPLILPEYMKENYKEYIELMIKSWDFDPNNRPNFKEISFKLKEISFK